MNHNWGYAGKTGRGVKLWHCPTCGRTVEALAKPAADLCDEGKAPVPPDADARITAVSRYILSVAGPGAEFFVAIAFRDRPAVSSMSNMPTPRQIEFLRYLLGNFERGEVVEDKPIRFDPVKGTDTP